jgi:hypothetical protein
MRQHEMRLSFLLLRLHGATTHLNSKGQPAFSTFGGGKEENEKGVEAAQ